MKLVRHPYVVRLHEAGYLTSEILNLDIDSTVILVIHEIYMFSLWYLMDPLTNNVLFQVLASRTKIYIILEYITGGELFDKIVSSLILNPLAIDGLALFWGVRGVGREFLNFKLLLLLFAFKLSGDVIMIVKIHQGRLSEAESRRYFQQLIDGADYCHSKGVYHRDLKVFIGWNLESNCKFFVSKNSYNCFLLFYSLKIFYLIPLEI